jgi:hypothetical protein
MEKKDCKKYSPNGCKLKPDAPMIICDLCPWYEEINIVDINTGRNQAVTKEEVSTLLSGMKITTNKATVTMDEVRTGLDAAKLSKEDYTQALFCIQRAGGLM